MKIDALSFSFAGDKYLGTPYDVMDCQKFVEKCMSDCGLYKDLPGSNSWYRECLRNGWAGKPEECIKIFGSIPKGALIFIREEVSESTPAKFRNDGIGDIVHMGIKTGRNKGAINSSEKRGGVVESEFHDKIIPHGGWNRVGLLNYFNYGKTVNWVLEHSEPIEIKQEDEKMKAIVRSDNGSPVNLRKKPSGDLLDRVPVGSSVDVLGTNERGDWSKVQWGKRVGWMKTDFLEADDSHIPSEPDEDMQEDDPQDEDETSLDQAMALLSETYEILKGVCDRILNVIGRG